MYKVIIADDEPIVRAGIASLIDWESLDCKVVTQAVDGEELLRYVRFFTPDIVVCDIKMPGVGGIEAAKYIYENYPQTKVILLTGYADFSYAQAAIKYGVVDYVTKTGALNGLIEVIEKAKKMIDAEKKTPGGDARLLILRAALIGELDFDSADAKAAEDELKIKNAVVAAVQVEGSLRPAANLRSFLDNAFDRYDSFIVPISAECACAIINEATGKAGEIAELCEGIASTLRKLIKAGALIAISGEAAGFRDLSAAYGQTVQTRTGAFLDQDKAVLTPWDPSPAPADIRKLNDGVDGLICELKRGRIQEALRRLSELSELYRLASPDNARSTGIVLAHACGKLMAEYGNNGVSKSIGEIDAAILESRRYDKLWAAVAGLIARTGDFITDMERTNGGMVRDARVYIEENYTSDITPSRIANAIHVNSSYLSRIYREKTGSTLIHDINIKRIEKAKELLSRTDMRISDIAEGIGLSDPAYFSHFFKKHTGLSPREYKNKCKRGYDKND